MPAGLERGEPWPLSGVLVPRETEASALPSISPPPPQLLNWKGEWLSPREGLVLYPNLWKVVRVTEYCGCWLVMIQLFPQFRPLFPTDSKRSSEKKGTVFWVHSESSFYLKSISSVMKEMSNLEEYKVIFLNPHINLNSPYSAKLCSPTVPPTPKGTMLFSQPTPQFVR